MKKLTISFCLLCFVFLAHGQPEEEKLSKKDRDYLIEYMKRTRSEMIQKLKNVSVEQWHYAPDTSTWSLAGIAEHILIVEGALMQRAKSSMKGEYNLEKMATTYEKQEEMLDFIVGRQKKVEAPKVIHPTGKYATAADFVKEFKAVRTESIKYVKDVDDPLKAYYQPNPLFGSVNGYHWLVFVPSHNERHMKQMDELIQTESFPSS